MKSLSIYYAEVSTSMTWNLSWLMSLTVFLCLLLVIYPGDQSMKNLVPLLQDPYFQDLLGNFGSASPGYSLWISFMLPFLSIFILIYAVTNGVRTAVQSISDGTGELLYSLPVSRAKFLVTRVLSNVTPLILYFIIQLVILSIPIGGHSINIDALMTLTWWGSLFCIFGLTLGILIGLLAGNAVKGHQISILVILIFYALQILSRINPNIASLNELNPLSFYQPDQYLLGKGFVKDEQLFGITLHYYPILLIVLTLLFLFLGIKEFNRKDLTDDAGFHLNFIKKMGLRRKKGLKKSSFPLKNYIIKPFVTIKRILFPKNVRSSPFVFWARLFERKLPVTADFIYSDNMLLFITFIALILFFPIQIGYYPGDKEVTDSISVFANSGIFLVFTYGHNLLSHPYLWYLVANSIGITWIILFPLTFFWVRKAIRNDGNTGTGEILGGIPLNKRNVVFQRILAIFIELIVIIFLMVIWVLLSESITGQTYDKMWELISIIALIPLYMFLVTFTAILALFFKQKGGLLSGLFLIGIIFSYIVSVLNPQLDTWYLKGIFSLYDPILIILNKSLFTNNYGLVILSFLAIISLLILYTLTPRFTWLNITNNSKNQDFL